MRGDFERGRTACLGRPGMGARDTQPLAVPAIFVAEIANALRMATKRPRPTVAQAQHAAGIVDGASMSSPSCCALI